jgi:nucleotide-binding universal stress UspA family protein
MLPRTILSPVDFSNHSKHALRWAAAFAARCRCPLTVLSVVDPLLADAARIRLGYDLVTTETEPALREFVGATWRQGERVPEPIVFKAVVGEPAPSILDAARADGANLIVMGTQGLGGFRKWLLGSTTQRVLRRTEVPVLAVPSLSDDDAVSQAPDINLSHILAATDFSDSSIAAARTAVELSSQWGASLTLAHAVVPVRVPDQWQPIVQESEEMRVASARAKLEALAGELSAAPACDQAVALGDPAEVIGAMARQRGSQLIVMGLASEHGGFAPSPGSIAYRVLSSGTLPVLVVPARAAATP